MNLRETSINKDTLEDFSKELILKAYTIYERLLVILEAELIQEYREAFASCILNGSSYHI